MFIAYPKDSKVGDSVGKKEMQILNLLKEDSGYPYSQFANILNVSEKMVYVKSNA